ncbi:apolipophorins isoform X2 [Diabrotica virgifera virgifera]|uniref:Apolipophorins isoform X2 n=1 Tax=Diabrotica virgifera virgifera TaxID=50390 RepID=A0A6P7GDI7_DIAVI|nr:apolipophorins isoform X2 [Diabrotica virgifera virgifera]
MGRRGPLRLGLALAFVLVAQQTLADQVCRTGCRKSNTQLFKYVPGTTYKYNYEGKIDISLSSAEGQVASTDVKAVVLLTQLGDCNQLLRLQNVQVLTGNSKKHGHIPDVEKAIQLNFHDGHIEDSICAEPTDTQNSLNLKRAIASLFQVNLKTGHETDIFGLCPTEYAQHKEGADLVVIKGRNLNKCAYREHLRQDFFATTFNLNSEIKSSPILNGDYSAKLRIKNGILNQANVIENYLYLPFSVGKSGAKAEINSKLHLVGTSKDNPKAAPSVPKSIIFDNPHPVIAPNSGVNVILNAVKEVVKTIDIVVGDKTAKKFVDLIKTVKAAKKDDLLAVYNQVRSGVGIGDKVAAKKIFLDALLQAGTGDAIEVAITLLKSNELSDQEKQLVYIGLSLVKHATENSIKTASQLLAIPNLPDQAYLGIGNLVGRYCQQHPCDKVDALNQITQKLIQKLGNGHPKDKKAENEIILVLKTLGNFGHLNDNVVTKIVSIAENRQAAERLRAFALEAYLSDPCKDKVRNSAIQILQNIQNDSELRIKAYLVLAKCPNAKVGNVVKALLEKEQSYQVGGFIASHIRNLKASANPDKQVAKQFLGLNVPKRFPVDPRKWSYNGEVSYAVDTLGAAASSEANVIYSPNAFLPRSTNLNVTAELFGHSFNFLELSLRQQNLDRLVEHYFGPKGVINTASLSEIWKNKNQQGNKLWREFNEKLKSSLRARRDVSRKEIENIGKLVQLKENPLDKDLDIDLSLKAFGSEIFHQNLNAYQDGLSPDVIIDKLISRFNEGLDKLKNFEETVRTNIQFLDAELDYPTSLGFPLRLAVEGTSNTQVKAEGSIDVRALLNNRDNNLHIKLIPSASIELSGRLTLDALVVENGLKVVSNLYTATGGDVRVNFYNGGKGVDVKFGLPVQIQKLISANHQIVFESREHAGQVAVTPLKFAQAKDFSICFDQLSEFIGLALCAELNGPNLAGKQVPVLPFPFSGDAKVSVSIENEDLKEFHFKNVVNKDYTSGEVLLESIGNNGQKKLSIQVQSEIYPQKFIKAVLSSPVKSAFAEGRITNTNQEKSLLLKAGQDNVETYLKFGVAISGSQDKAVYSPILEYKTPDGNQQLPVQVEGRIIAEQNGPNRKYIFDNVRVHLPNQKVLGINGNIGNEAGNQGEDFFSDLTVSEGQQSGSLAGRLHLDAHQLNLNAEVKNSINPGFNFKLQGGLKRSSDLSQLDSNWQLIHGQDLASKTNIISLATGVTRRYKTQNDFHFGFKNKVSYPLIGLVVNIEADQKPKSVDYDFDFQYNDIKFGSELDFNVDKKSRGDFELVFGVHGLENKVDFKASRELVGADKSQINNELDINGLKLAVKGLITHNIKPSSVDIGADLTVVLPTHPTPFKVDSGLQYNPTDFAAHNKILSGNVVVVDAFLNANKNGNANGSVKVNIKNVLVVNGQLKSVKGVGNGHIKIDAQSLKKVVKAESDFEIQPPTLYKIVVTLYPSFDKDPNQKIILSTNSKLSPTSVDTKNSVNLLGKVLEVNLNVAKSGDAENKRYNGEVEVILPNDQYLQGKVNGAYNTRNDILNGQGQASVEYRKNKNTPGRKLSLSGKYNNVNIKEGVYDVSYNLAADDASGRNVNADLNVKVSKEGERRVLDTSTKIYGSILKQALKSGLVFKYTVDNGEFEITSSYGPEVNGKLGGKYDVRDEGKPVSGELDIELLLPSQNLKTLRSKLSGSVLLPSEKSTEITLSGAASIYADNRVSSVPLVDFSTDGQVRASDKDGDLKANLKTNKLDPISVVAGYSCKDLGQEKHQVTGNVALQYSKGKNLKLDGTLTKLAKHQYKLEAELDTPFEALKKNHLLVETKGSEDYQQVTSKVVLTNDGKKWQLDSDLKSSEISPLIHLKLRCPEGKLTEVLLKGNKVSDKELAFEYRLLCQKKDFLLEGKLDANVADIDNFYVKGSINSPKLELNKITFEATNKGNKAAKKVQIHVKSADKNLVSGSTTYQAREEHGKYIIEGSGTLKIKEENKAANFKFISQDLTQEKNGEQGFQISFVAGVGNNAFDSELKITNKQFRILDSYCEKNKECAHFELDSKVNENDAERFSHVLEITLDLKKLGLPNEFGLKAVTTRKGYVLDHTVDIHFQSPQNSKYQYSVYLHPDEAGVSLTTPNRIVALESQIRGPRNVRLAGGKVTAEVSFYLDKKNQPNQKASLSGWINVDDKGKGVKSAVSLSHPGLQRPLSITFESTRGGQTRLPEIYTSTVFDIFDQPSQKIVVDYKFTPEVANDNSHAVVYNYLLCKSVGLGINIEATEEIRVDRKAISGVYWSRIKYVVGSSNYDNLISVKGNRQGSEVILRLLNIDFLKIENKYQLSNDDITVDTELTSYDNRPLVSHLEVKKFKTILFTLGHKNTPKQKLQINSGFIPGQVADVRADYVTGGGTLNLFHATLKLDEANFLKPDYNVNAKGIEKVFTQGKEGVSRFVNGLEKIEDEIEKDIRKEASQLSELAKKAAPNLQAVRQYYSTELQRIKNEIVQDKSLQEFGELIKTIFFSVSELVETIFVRVFEVLEAVTHAVQSVVVAFVESFEKHIVPALKDLVEKLSGIAGEILNTLVEITSSYLATVSEIIEKYQPEIKQLTATFGELGQDVARFIQKSYEQVRRIFINLYRRLVEELRALPIFEELRAQWDDFVKNGLPNADGIVGALKEVAATIKDLVPGDLFVSKEVYEFVDILTDYLEKKIKQQPVDDIAVLNRLFTVSANLVQKILTLITSSTADIQQPQVSISLDFFKKLPKLVAVKLSPINYILLEDPSKEILDLGLSLVTKPKEWLAPFQLFGMILQAQHVYTFDGKYLNFQGTCKYLLARDAVNGNFTVIGNSANGRLNTISLSDKEDIITVNEHGQVILNGAHAEFPVRKAELAAYRSYENIHLKSTAGVHIVCTPTLQACGVYVSGFYHGQVKGLLGKGNNEPFDDLTVANGKIVTSDVEFVNSYKIGNCQPAVVPPSAPSNPACEKLFGWESPLRLCYSFVDTEIYKRACNYGFANNVKDTEISAASAYVGRCHEHNIPVSVPSRLAQCLNGPEPHNVGDQFSVKVPKNAADIVVLVDTIKSNEPVYNELVKPLIQELTKGLAAKGLTDVETHLITYGGENQWPSHVTVGGKLVFKGKAPEIKFSENPQEPPVVGELSKSVEALRSILRDIKLALGQDLQAKTYTEGYEYPFRAHAVKIILAVTSKPCEVGKLYPKLRTLLFKNNQISLQLITPFEGLQVKDVKKTKDVIGFNDEHVFTFSQSKKKPEGTAELYKELQYDDYCVDFTVKNRGNVFVTDNFLDAKPDGKKQFLHTAAHNIIEEAVNLEQGLDCECRPSSAYGGKNICRESYSKEKSAPKRLSNKA